MFNLFIMFSMLLIPLFILFFNLYIIHWSMLLFLYNIIIISKLNFWMNYFWYSYITFLIMIGGLMIIFMYFSSIGSNYIQYKNKFFPFMFIVKLNSLFLMLFYFYSDIQYSFNNYTYKYFSFSTHPMSNMNNFLFFNQKNFKLSSMFYSENLWFTGFCLIFLLIMLIYIIKSTLTKKGSLK